MPRGKSPIGVDLVALVLALGLTLLVVLILVATIVQILNNNRPEVTLSENATQILVASVGAFSGLLGGYLGYSLRDRGKEDDNPKKQP